MKACLLKKLADDAACVGAVIRKIILGLPTDATGISDLLGSVAQGLEPPDLSWFSASPVIS